MKDYIPFDWKIIEDKSMWLQPCEESWYYAEKWRREGRKSILDLGCGLGRHSVLFAKYGFKVTAMDVSKDALVFLKDYMKKGIMKATISQNQEEVGRLAAVSVYEYLHKMNTYGNADWKPERLILVKPTLLLRANIE